MNPSHLIL